MASTNKTPNIQLSQFIGTDKPSWLSDYNSDMLKIDTAIAGSNTGVSEAKAAANNALTIANQANTKSDTNTSSISTINSQIQTINTDVETVEGIANNATSLANTAIQNANTAIQNANDVSTNVTSWITATLNKPSSVWNNDYLINIRLNKYLNIMQIFGRIHTANGNAAPVNTVIMTLPEQFRPSSDKTLYNMGVGLVPPASTNNPSGILNAELDATTGNIIVTNPNAIYSWMYFNLTLITTGWFN